MRVVLSMTTIPSRIEAVVPVVQNLLAQSFPFNMLCLCIPKLCVRQNTEYVIPSKLQELCEQDKRFVIKHLETDWGPGTKIIPSMIAELETKNDIPSVLISVDDDVLLETHTIEELVAAHLKHPLHILGFMGVTLQGRFVHAEHAFEATLVDSLGGYRGVLYPPHTHTLIAKTFNLLHKKHMHKLHVPVMDDDHALQQCAILHKIERFVVPTRFPCFEDTPETNIVPHLNIRFLKNTDGLSGKTGKEDKIQASRDITTLFFTDK